MASSGFGRWLAHAKRGIGWLAAMFAITLGILVVLEGAASLVLFGDSALERTPRIAKEFSSEYDPELGWIAMRSFHAPDFFGPGRDIRTESHGFRADQELSPQLPDGRVRIICSGDSFTWGYGVGNDDTWCTGLGDAYGVETVNMGQSGYGVDQSYLLFMREGTRLEHTLHVFAFIEDDFVRAQSPVFLGFPKPIIELAEDSLVTRNQPVPTDSRIRRLGRRLASPASQLRLVRILTAFAGRIAEASRPHASPEATLEVFAALVGRLQAVAREDSAALLLVFLPTEGMHARAQPSVWQRGVYDIANSLSVPFVDLTDHLSLLPGSEVPALFQQMRDFDTATMPFVFGAGHYSELGNQWVAESLTAHIAQHPDLARSLETSP
ncbi:MAG: hypothetical protein WEB90_04855 [Gemmatimonadota bacterium]